MKYLASVVSLIILAKTLMWNKVMFPASNSRNLAELVVNSIRSRVCPSHRLFFCLSGRFLGIVLLVFSAFWHDARNPYEVVRHRAGYPRKFLLPQKLGKWVKNGQKQGLLNILKSFVFNFY